MIEKDLARLVREVAAALEAFAGRIDVVSEAENDRLRRLIETATYLGFRQKQILELPELATDRGITTGDVVRAVGITQPNAHLTLKGMVARGWVEKLAQLSPQRYRLSTDYR